MTKAKDLEKRIIELQRQCAECAVEISKREQRIATLNASINELQSQLLSSDTVGALARKLFHKIDNKIMYQFNERGKKKPSSGRTHPQILLTGKESYNDLLNIAKKSDAEDFFSLRRKISKNQLRPHYRIAAKAYRTSRDGLLYTGARVYRKVKGSN